MTTRDAPEPKDPIGQFGASLLGLFSAIYAVAQRVTFSVSAGAGAVGGMMMALPKDTPQTTAYLLYLAAFGLFAIPASILDDWLRRRRLEQEAEWVRKQDREQREEENQKRRQKQEIEEQEARWGEEKRAHERELKNLEYRIIMEEQKYKDESHLREIALKERELSLQKARIEIERMRVASLPEASVSPGGPPPHADDLAPEEVAHAASHSATNATPP